jgi:hypothetical protein
MTQLNISKKFEPIIPKKLLKKFKVHYKTKNLSKILEKCYLKPVDVIRDTLVQETMTYYKNIPQSDDITLVVIKVVPAVDHERGCDE